jgi:hypothetical protein
MEEVRSNVDVADATSTLERKLKKEKIIENGTSLLERISGLHHWRIQS